MKSRSRPGQGGAYNFKDAAQGTKEASNRSSGLPMDWRADLEAEEAELLRPGCPLCGAVIEGPACDEHQSLLGLAAPQVAIGGPFVVSDRLANVYDRLTDAGQPVILVRDRSWLMDGRAWPLRAAHLDAMTAARVQAIYAALGGDHAGLLCLLDPAELRRRLVAAERDLRDPRLRSQARMEEAADLLAEYRRREG